MECTYDIDLVSKSYKKSKRVTKKAVAEKKSRVYV